MILVNLSVVFLLLLDSAMSEAERLEFAWRDVTAAAGSRPCLYEHLQLAENMGGGFNGLTTGIYRDIVGYKRYKGI